GYGFANITPVITAYNSSGSNAGITYSACGVTNSYGVAVCYITSKEAGTFTLALSSPTSAGGGTVTFTQVARSLSFVAQPSSSNTSKT
ncbi:hypothetical protein, partial [Pseudomonas sp. FW305-122]|uniref:hypothetical protein n=1 Tax=Pseudomonas sp. FW305-122 TaxID=2070561 RepID=UPI001C476456